METIGIIEDDELLGQALAIALRKEGYETLSAVNCREGRGLLEKNPDLLLIDINLPDGDGISFCRDMRRYQEIPLTMKEYRLLEYLAKNKGQLLTKNQILEQVWDVDGAFVGENTVSVTVNRLRRKIEPDGADPVYIKNVFGQGYVFGE